ncbi:MAG: TIGR02147 family protein [Bdellovibrionota bacterium]|nr:TIGR02147 family protein [Bdellovibrionota bacterium]
MKKAMLRQLQDRVQTGIQIAKIYKKMAIQEKFVQLLNQELKQRKSVNPSYSMRAYARDLGLSSASLSQILSFKRNLSFDTANKILEKANIEKALAKQLRSELLRLKEQNKLNRKATFLEPNQPLKSLAPEDEYIIKNWWAFAILTLSTTKSFIGRKDFIAQRLNLEEEQVEECLEILYKSSYLNKNYRGEYVFAGKNFTTGTDIPNEFLKQQHRDLLKIAALKQEELSVDERDFSFICMNGNKNDLPRMKEWIKRFRRDFMNEFESKENEDVFRLCLQLFPVTEDLNHDQ